MALVLWGGFSSFLVSQGLPEPSGPAKGKLLLLGGGISQQHADLMQKLGGSEIVVLPSAYSDEEIARDTSFQKVKNRFAKLGFTRVRILHTRDRNVANSERFSQMLDETQSLLILGGKTQKLTATYAGTYTEAAMRALLERGGLIAGVSAGSGVQASYFSDRGLEKGFEFLQGVMIMNHFLSKNKAFTHTEEIKKHPENIAFGIDDLTGILIAGDKMEVVGQSYVAVYDGKMYHRAQDSMCVLPPNSERFYLLKNGDRYHLKKQEVESNRRLTPMTCSPGELLEYCGTYRATEKDFHISLSLSGDTLFLSNSWGWKPYPILALEKDVFYALNRNMWFQFLRDPDTGSLLSVRKMKSILQEKVIVELEKTTDK